MKRQSKSKLPVTFLSGFLGAWRAETGRTEWAADQETLAEIERIRDAKSGDRRQEIVFIDQNLNQTAIIEALDACLVNSIEKELTAMNWRKINHPFALWNEAAESATKNANAN